MDIIESDTITTYTKIVFPYIQITYLEENDIFSHENYIIN